MNIGILLYLTLTAESSTCFMKGFLYARNFALLVSQAIAILA